MSKFVRGGRGHQAPYKTTHCRLPEPCKDTVQLISDTWKNLLGDEDEETKAQNLLTDVRNVVTMHNTQEFNKPINGYVYKPVTELEDSNKLVNKVKKLLEEAVAIDSRSGKKIKDKVSEALALLQSLERADNL